jgi:hypothetical protein
MRSVGVAALLVVALASGCGKGEQTGAGGGPSGPAAVRARAGDLADTVVTAVLDCPIEQGQNVLWCCTFQLAWNDYRSRFGTDFPNAEAVPLVAALNATDVAAADMGDAGFVAVGGVTGQELDERLRAAVGQTFGSGGGRRLLSYIEELPAGMPVAYATMHTQLAFQWAFRRFDRPFTFMGREVETFGIEQYSKEEDDEAAMAGQVVLHDYVSHEDFVMELRTTSQEDRLILARVPPAETLAETVEAVRERAAGSAADDLDELADLRVPVVDFDLVRSYSELQAVGFAMSRQRTRFRLDETGTVLESEGMALADTLAEHLIFNAPFLVLLERKDAANPYFALWVGNAELLVPWGAD